MLKLAKGANLLERMNDDVTPINARPKRRQPEAFEDASLALLEGRFQPGDQVLVDAADGELTFSKAEAAASAAA